MSIDERLERIETLVSINAKEVLTVKEVSLLIGRSESRIRHLVADREIPHYKNDRGQVNFRRSEIEAWQLGEKDPHQSGDRLQGSHLYRDKENEKSKITLKYPRTMKILKSIIRLMILLSLSTSVLITIFIADPNPIGPSTFGLWVLSLLGSKLIAVLSAVALVLLYNVWARRDPWLMRFERWCRRAEETPDYYS